MSNWKLSKSTLEKLKVASFELPKDCFEYLKTIIYVNLKKYNQQLYGHIKEEYMLAQLSDSFYNFSLINLFFHKKSGTTNFIFVKNTI